MAITITMVESKVIAAVLKMIIPKIESWIKSGRRMSNHGMPAQ